MTDTGSLLCLILSVCYATAARGEWVDPPQQTNDNNNHNNNNEQLLSIGEKNFQHIYDRTNRPDLAFTDTLPRSSYHPGLLGGDNAGRLSLADFSSRGVLPGEYDPFEAITAIELAAQTQHHHHHHQHDDQRADRKGKRDSRALNPLQGEDEEEEETHGEEGNEGINGEIKRNKEREIKRSRDGDGEEEGREEGDIALVEAGASVGMVRAFCEVCILVMQQKERAQPHLCAGLNTNYYITCVEVLESLLRSDKAVVYWLKTGCMHLDPTGPEIVRPCPAINICSWVPNLFSQPPMLVRDGVETLCPKDPKFLPTVPSEYQDQLNGKLQTPEKSQ